MLNSDVSPLAVKLWNGLVMSCICLVLCLGLNKLKYELPTTPVSVIEQHLFACNYFCLYICSWKHMKRIMVLDEQRMQGHMLEIHLSILAQHQGKSLSDSDFNLYKKISVQLHNMLLFFCILFIFFPQLFIYICIHLFNDIHTGRQKKEFHCTTEHLLLFSIS